ncbi:hypothetical protein [Clostridium sp. C2-6-12]|nr:hypothetical protein [Clostridium sp. C2-6-12]
MVKEVMGLNKKHDLFFVKILMVVSVDLQLKVLYNPQFTYRL